MEKFLKITNAPKTSQLISLSRLKTVTTGSGTATTVVLKYSDGTATTVTTANQVDFNVYDALIDAMEQALATSWQKSQFPVALPLAPTGIANA
tara:strand:- start:269 stop:547 length:279 start_codon:yes stop_codon:yes gene_type:complete